MTHHDEQVSQLQRLLRQEGQDVVVLPRAALEVLLDVWAPAPAMRMFCALIREADEAAGVVA